MDTANYTEDLSPRIIMAQLSSSRATWEIVLETLVVFAVILIAFIGNVLTCVAVYKNQRLRTSSNYYVVALALSDISIATLVSTFGIAVTIQGRWMFGHFACQAQSFLSIMLATFSIYIMMLIAINRYFTVLRRAFHRKYFTPRNIVLSVLAAWLLSLYFPVSYSLAGNIYEFHTGKLVCSFNPASLNIYHGLICGFTNVVFPYTVIVVTYYFINKEVKTHNKRLHGPGPNSSNISVEEIQITRMVFAIILGFTVCWTPFFVIDTLGLIMGQYALPRPVYILYTLTIASSSSINPIIYSIMNKDFRNEFQQILTPLTRCRKTIRVFPGQI